MKTRIAVTCKAITPIPKEGRMGNFTWIYNNAIDMVPEEYTLRGLEVRGDGFAYSTLTVDFKDEPNTALNWVLSRSEDNLKNYGKIIKVENWGEVS